jgi:hypothetical protein
MLEPSERTLLTKALEPPDGYLLDFAIGTTFSLDLLALLTAPLAFTLFDRASEETAGQEESLELLESLRRYARRIALFCHAGRIALPRARYPQFAWLERSVIECRSSSSGGVFHPKVWVLRYVSREKNVRYRTLCLSRNLTPATSWDTLLAVDGELRPSGRLEVDPGPLADFTAALPTLAIREVSDTVAARMGAIAEELRRVAFVPPPGFQSLAFHPIGISRYAGWPFPTGNGRLLVVSPFLSPGSLERLARGRSSTTLISTPDALAELSRRPTGVTSFFTLDDDAVADLPPTADETPLNSEEAMQLCGLHAKAYVIEQGSDAHVWTGSANSTDGAFHQNVEFMVRLTGPKGRFGLDAILSSSKDSLRFVDVLKDATQLVATTGPDEEQDGLEARIESVRTWLVERCLVANVVEHDNAYDVLLRGSVDPQSPLPLDVTVTCWPVMIGEAHACTIGTECDLARFVHISLEGLSAFFAFKVVARDRGAEREARFVLNIPLQGAPEDREERLLRGLIADRARLVRFLTLLLSDEGTSPGEMPDITPRPTGDSSSATSTGAGAQGMFELLVRALDRAPHRLDDVAGLIKDLPGGAGSDPLFPEQFDAIWQPIWEARRRMSHA